MAGETWGGASLHSRKWVQVAARCPLLIGMGKIWAISDNKYHSTD